MEDGEEIQSHNSAISGSPTSSSSPLNGRITVTVASVAPSIPVSPPPNTLALALPVQSGSRSAKSNGGGGGGVGGSGGGREDCWSEGATAVLIEAWGERYLELSRGNLKQKHWKEVADIVSSREDYHKIPKTDIQCKNRIDTVKKKYKQEKAKLQTGGGYSKWIFYDKLDQLIGPTAKIPVSGSSGGSGGGSQRVPVGIPVKIRSSQYQPPPPHPPQSQLNHQLMKPLMMIKSNQSQRMQFRKPTLVESDSDSEPELSADSTDSLPPPPPPRPSQKRPRTTTTTTAAATTQRETNQGGEVRKRGYSMKELTHAILRFGEAYERSENAKLLQVVEMEKQRMKFTKELELQRMQFFMKTQLEISQMKHHGKRVGSTSNNHHSNNNNNNNNSDSSS